MPEPHVSVIIPTYRRAHCVGRAIQSVLDQTYADFELIVVDDGSPDNTRAVVAAFDDPRVRYVDKPNGGLASARNAGIAAARGTLLCFLDDDDAFFPQKLAVQVAQLESSPALGLVVADHEYVDADNSSLGCSAAWQRDPRLDLQRVLFDCPMGIHDVLIRREWVERVGGFDATLSAAEDWDFWARIALAGCRMAWTQRVLATLHVHPTSMVQDAGRHTQQALRMLDKLYARNDLPADVQAWRTDLYVRVLLSGASREIAAGQFDHAQTHIRRALVLAPHLLAQEGRPLRDHLMAHVGHVVVVRDEIAYVDALFDHLPAEAQALAGLRQETVALAAMKCFYRAHRRGRRVEMAQALATAARHNPGWLRNRGVWALLFRPGSINRPRAQAGV